MSTIDFQGFQNQTDPVLGGRAGGLWATLEGPTARGTRGSARRGARDRAQGGPQRPPTTSPAPAGLGRAWERSWAVLRALEAAVGV
jgi:hypothetical protein